MILFGGKAEQPQGTAIVEVHQYVERDRREQHPQQQRAAALAPHRMRFSIKFDENHRFLIKIDRFSIDFRSIFMKIVDYQLIT